MSPAHIDLYLALPPEAAALVWQSLNQAHLTDEPVPPEIDGPVLARLCRNLSHAEVVLSMSKETSELGLITIEHLIQKPIYMCAQGETGEVTTDIHGIPIAVPLGHRRGEPPSHPTIRQARQSGQSLTRARMRSDPRIIYWIMEKNPKATGSGAYHRFNLYQQYLSIDETMVLGVTRADIRWDLMKGFIRACMPHELHLYTADQP